VSDEELSALPNPEFRGQAREIESFLNRGLAGASHKVTRHRYRRGHLVKVWESDQDNEITRRHFSGTAIPFHRVVRDASGNVICDAWVDVGNKDALLVLSVGSAATCAEP
jgi:hypothetical protein